MQINDIWRSKSAASDREKDDFEVEAKQHAREVLLAKETLENLKQELCHKDKIIAEHEITNRENQQAFDRKMEAIIEKDNEIKKFEQDQQIFLTQVSQRDGSIRDLNETIRVRDERLKEKDEIIFKLNSSIDVNRAELKDLEQKTNEFIKRADDKDSVIVSLRTQLSSAARSQAGTTCHTDSEKECERLKETSEKLKEALENSQMDNRKLQNMVDESRKTIDESMVLWKNEKATMQVIIARSEFLMCIVGL